MKPQDLIDTNTALLMLKAAIDFNTGILAMASQVVATNSQGNAIKLKHVQRECKRMGDDYLRTLAVLMDDLDKKEAAENDTPTV